MSLHKLIANYAAYNTWANTRMVEWLSTFSTEQLYQRTPSSFDSLDATLQHMLRTQNYWLAFISEQDTSHFSWNYRPNEVENILKEMISVSLQIQETFTAYTEDDLQKVLHLNSPWAKNDLSRYEYILHVINHSTYHRGQLVTMAHSMGLKEGIPNTDYNMYNCL